MTLQQRTPDHESPHIKYVLSLPEETIANVFSYCDTPTLKNARLGCSSWAHGATAQLLFESVVLPPALYFYERFAYTFQTSPVARQIRKLSIDLRWYEQHLSSRRYPTTGAGYPPNRTEWDI